MYKAGMPTPPIPTVRSPSCKDQTKILSVYFAAAQSVRDLHQRRYAIAIAASSRDPTTLKVASGTLLESIKHSPLYFRDR